MFWLCDVRLPLALAQSLHSPSHEPLEAHGIGSLTPIQGVSHLIYSELDVTSCERLTNR